MKPFESRSPVSTDFLRLLRFSVASDTPDSVPFLRPLSAEAWQEVWQEALKHAVSGILYTGLQRLPHEYLPPRRLLMQWYALTERIRQTNARIDAYAAELSERFAQDGFRSCVLKGQGIATLYPDPGLRMPGDIDIWVEGGRKQILRYVDSHFPRNDVRYHHVGCRVYPDVDVEVHFMPTWMNAPSARKRLEQWFRQTEKDQFCHYVDAPSRKGRIPIPTPEFNAVYVPLHIFRHLIGEGVGLRQIIDCYFVLCAQNDTSDASRILTELKLEKFTAALMYVLQELFGLSERRMMFPPDVRWGRFLLEEIIQSGNFGKYDSRLKRKAHESAFYRFSRAFRRNCKFTRLCPSEILWDAPFKLWHYTWQSFHDYRK